VLVVVEERNLIKHTSQDGLAADAPKVGGVNRNADAPLETDLSRGLIQYQPRQDRRHAQEPPI
jgi:hypothetical protein